jgi:predicted NBD/HSP70 family sugar kinase
MTPLHIAVDLGGTTCRVAPYDSLDVQQWVMPPMKFAIQKVDKDAAAQEMFDAFNIDFAKLRETIYEVANGPPTTISLAVAGKVDPARRKLLGAGNLVHWVGEDIVEYLTGYFGCSVILGNDAEAAALAEALYGHGQEQDFLSVIWGSGVGGCRLHWEDGKPIALPTELGHQHLPTNSGILCGCGWHNCLEAWCGGDNIAKRHGDPSNPRLLTRKDWKGYGQKMGAGLYNSVVHHPVPLVVCAGGVACKQKWLLPIIEKQLKSELKIDESPTVKLSMFGESAGTLGALALGNRLHNHNQAPAH